MKAEVGDWLVVDGVTIDQPEQRGLITEVRGPANGSIGFGRPVDGHQIPCFWACSVMVALLRCGRPLTM
jgi:hypothetical protein